MSVKGHTGQFGAHQTLHCSLSGVCHVIRPLGFGAIDRWLRLSLWCTGQSGATWRHRLSLTFWCFGLRWQSTVGEVDRCSWAHRIVRWFLAEERCVFLRAASSLSAPVHTGQSVAPQVGADPFCSILIEFPQGLFSLYVYVNFMHLRRHKLGKVVSP
jgi:hypothetical protein